MSEGVAPRDPLDTVTGTQRILIVDDEPGLRSVLHEFLVDSGYEVLDADDGRDALRILEDTPVDLTVLDIFMPNVDGLEFLNELRARKLEMRVIAVSGGGSTGNWQSPLECARRLGAAASFEKPVDLDALLGQIRECLAA